MPRTGRWSEYWFGAGSLVRLGAFRIAILVLALWDLVGYGNLAFADAAAVSAGGPTREWRPIYAFEVLGLEPIGTGAATAVFAVLMAAIGLGIVGLFTRMACVVVAVLAFYWTGLVYSFGKPHHDKVALTFALLALPLAPVGARLSIDSLIARVRRASRGRDPREVPRAAELAMLPIRLTQVTVALGYFFAGGSKLLLGGTAWLNGYTQQGIMMGHNNVWSAAFAESLLACQVTSVVTVLSQLTFPLVLVWPVTRWFYVPVMTGMHLVTWKTMDTGPYMSLWGTLICFIALERVPGTLRAWLTRGPVAQRVGVAAGCVAVLALVVHVLQLNLPGWLFLALIPPVIAVIWWWPLGSRGQITVVYDGGCRLCRRALAVLLALDWTGKVEVVSLTDWPAVHARFPALDADACMRDMHVIDGRGRVHVGYDGYRVIAWRLPLLAPLAWLTYLPPVAGPGRRIYRRVADSRLRDGCGGDEVCSVGPSPAGEP